MPSAAQVEVAVAQAQRLVDRRRPRRSGTAASRTRRARSRAVTLSSISPVGRFGLTFPASRRDDRRRPRRRRARGAAARRARTPRRSSPGGRRAGARPAAVAQVDEDQPAVVAAAVHPAGDADARSPVAVGVERAAQRVAVAVGARCASSDVPPAQHVRDDGGRALDRPPAPRSPCPSARSPRRRGSQRSGRRGASACLSWPFSERPAELELRRDARRGAPRRPARTPSGAAPSRSPASAT